MNFHRYAARIGIIMAMVQSVQAYARLRPLWNLCPQALVGVLEGVGFTLPSRVDRVPPEVLRLAINELDRAAITSAKAVVRGQAIEGLSILTDSKLYSRIGIQLGAPISLNTESELGEIWRQRSKLFYFDQHRNELRLSAKFVGHHRSQSRSEADFFRYLIALEQTLLLQQNLRGRIGKPWVSQFFGKSPGAFLVAHRLSGAPDPREEMNDLLRLDISAKLLELLGTILPGYVTDAFRNPSILNSSRVSQLLKLTPADLSPHDLKQNAAMLGDIIAELEISRRQMPENSAQVRNKLESLLAQSGYHWDDPGNYHIHLILVDMPQRKVVDSSRIQHGFLASAPAFVLTNSGEITSPAYTVHVFAQTKATELKWVNCFDTTLDNVEGIAELRRLALQDLISRIRQVQSDMLWRAEIKSGPTVK